MNDISFDNVDIVPIRLPSNGTGKQGLIEVLIRPMTAQDEQLLSNKVLIKRGMVQDELMRRVIVGGTDKNGQRVDKVVYRDLYVADVLALLVGLRGISYGFDYTFEVRCEECGKKDKLTVNLETDIGVNFAPDDLEYEQSVTIGRGQAERLVHYHYPLQRDADEDIIKLVANCIDDVEGIPKEAIDMWVSNLRAGEFAVLRNAISDVPFGLDVNIQHACTSCGEETTITTLPLQASFFRYDTR